MAVEITIIKEDIKKDLTNFLIGISAAGISEDIFPELADMITKALSPTLDVANFADNLIDLLKRGNDIKDGKGVDFAPLIKSLQKGSPFLDNEGDSILISSIMEEESKPHSEEIIETPLNKLSDNKNDLIIIDDEGEDFAPTGNIDNKIENLVEDSPILEPTENGKEKFLAPSGTVSSNDFSEDYSSEVNKQKFPLEENPEHKANYNEPLGTISSDDSQTGTIPLLDGTIGDSEHKTNYNEPIGTISSNDSQTGTIPSLQRGDLGANAYAKIKNNIPFDNGDSITESDKEVTGEVQSLEQFITGKTNYNIPLETESSENVHLDYGDSIALHRNNNYVYNVPSGTTRSDEDQIHDENQTPTDITNPLTDNKEDEEILKNIKLAPSDNKKNEEITGIEQLASSIIDFASKSTRRQRQLEILLYNAIPYGITQKLYGLANAILNISDINISDVVGAAFEAKRIINKIKYLSAEEMGLYVSGAVNFFTIQFRRGITIKDMRLTPPTGPGVSFSIASIIYKDFKNRHQPKMLFNVPVQQPTQFIPSLPKDLTNELSIKKITSKVPTENDKKNSEREYSFNNEAGNVVVDFKRFDHPNFGFQQTASQKYSLDGGSTEIDFNELETKLKEKEGVWEIGSLYIWPVSDEGSNPKFIPFQFNPIITESGMAARYTATTILSRIGNLQSFVGTDSLTVTLNTAYIPISRIKEDVFNMKDIQLIELAYKSLTLPWFSTTDTTDGYKYFKPPLIKIIMGNKDKVNESTTGIKTTNSPYSNLLTYPDDVLGSSSKQGAIVGKLRHFKTFIATTVVITRTDDMPYFLDKDDDYLFKDTFGYNISMNLIEVTSNYHQILPNFKDYFALAYS